jgi:hypothetical protein
MAKKSAPKKVAPQQKRDDYTFGRPSEYRDEYCDLLVEWMAKGNPFCTFGKCIVEHYGLLKNQAPCEATLYAWVHMYPDFLEAKKIGKIYERDMWENLQKRTALTGEGNITAIIHALKNKFRASYGEREQHIKLNASMDVKQLVANMQPEQISQLVAAIEAKTLELEAGKNENS